MTPNDRRLETLRQLAAEYRPECVIELIWQACLTYDVESLRVRRLVEAGAGPAVPAHRDRLLALRLGAHRGARRGALRDGPGPEPRGRTQGSGVRHQESVQAMTPGGRAAMRNRKRSHDTLAVSHGRTTTSDSSLRHEPDSIPDR